MFELHETDVDGVPCFWVDSGRPTLAAQLVFRQGMADEALAESGWLHLLEHAALHGRGGGALAVNGSVSLLHTCFDAHGPAEAVAGHLGDVCDWLASPVLDDLERERNVLRAEAALHGGLAARALGWRYGVRGPGVVSQGEPGLGRATREALTARAARVFVRENAALVLDGPPPPGLRVTLPGGRLLEAAPARPLDQAVPAAYVDEGGPVLSGEVDRSMAATVAAEILQRVLRERLRHDAGVAYAPWVSYEVVDRDRVVILGGSDVLPELLPTLAGTMMTTIRALRTDVVRADWLTEALEAREQAMRDPAYGPSVAAGAARAHLDGRTASSWSDLLDELRAVDRTAVADVLRELTASVLLGVPGATAWHEQLPMLTFPTTRPGSGGRSFRSADWPASAQRLTVRQDGVEVSVHDQAHTVRRDDLAGVLVHADGGRNLVRQDGWSVTVHPKAWRRGAAAVEAVDALTPEHLRLPQATPLHTDGRRLPVGRRWWLGLRRALQSGTALHVYLVVMAGVAVAGLVTLHGLVVGVGVAGFVAAFRERRDRRADTG